LAQATLVTDFSGLQYWLPLPANLSAQIKKIGMDFFNQNSRFHPDYRLVESKAVLTKGKKTRSTIV
jgi:hypothetical protein